MRIRPIWILTAVILLSCNKNMMTGSASSPAEGGAKDPQLPTVKNVIFLIGDGMGLAQITAGMYLNNNKTALEKYPVVGLHKCHSHNDLVTDSAAGATAFSCGVKTVNGAVGVDHTDSLMRRSWRRRSAGDCLQDLLRHQQ